MPKQQTTIAVATAATATAAAVKAAAQHILVQGITFTGSGAATVCKLTPAGQAAVVKGSLKGTGPGNAVLAYVLANPAGLGPNNKYIRGTQPYYNYAAWYVAACGGVFNCSGGVYVRQNNMPAGSLCTPGGQPQWLTRHAYWALGQAVGHALAGPLLAAMAAPHQAPSAPQGGKAQTASAPTNT